MTMDYRLEQKRSLRTDVPGPRSAALAARRENVVGAGVASAQPFYVQDADGGILVDVDGNAFIDLGSGIAVTSVGASDAAVVGGVREQAGHFTHTCFLVSPYEGYVAVCEALAELTPGRHAKKAVLLNSGAEAVENAVKVARIATGRSAVVAFDHAFHGRTNLTMALTAKNAPYKGGDGTTFGPFAPEIYRAPMSYPFREENPEITGAQAAERAIRMMESQIGGHGIAAIIIEPVQGEGGFIVPAPGFLPRLAEYAREQGIVFIADEVQTGFCRTGAWFASEHEGIVPDLITVAKGMAGGLPLAGVVGRAELLDAVHGGGLGGTYGGNPVACAAALGAFGTMREADLNGRARRIEEIARPRLEALAAETGVVGDVRGRGAMLALEFVTPGGTEPDAEIVKRIIAGCRAEGVVILSAGTYGNVIRLLPPLVIGEDLLAEALDVLAAVTRAAAGALTAG
ncbi:MAG: 4-aminobutyrate--2-oxoglutarate transaminase [Micrococcus sp.]|nr:4-aminobutyrate--2-oxoglutarate transaminase [Micrococcus sp.]